MWVPFRPFATRTSSELGCIELVSLGRFQRIVCRSVDQTEKLSDNRGVVLVKFFDFLIEIVSACNCNGARCDLPVGQLFMP
jgi:hypothetical protein